MRSFSILLNRQVGYLAVIVAVLLATVLSAFASAAEVTQRSIKLSNASKAATGVTYEVKFTPTAAAGAFVIDFCSDSPLIGLACDAPDGMVVTSAESESAGVTDVTGTGNTIVVAKPLTAVAQTVVITGITNPEDAGPLYARIVTYDTAEHAGDYSSTDLGDGAVDQGSLALYITDTIGVTAGVLESLTFCVASAVITEDCANAADNLPTLALGETVGNTKALSASALSTGVLYAQISTNAQSGAIVNLKSDALGCGGLIREFDEEECYIAPALTGGTITAGQAKFGVKTGTAVATAGVTTATGTVQPATGSTYNNSTYEFNYVDGDETGVTSVYGDPFLDTDSAPANNQNIDFTFGASITNDTPPGKYSTSLSMIATGKF